MSVASEAVTVPAAIPLLGRLSPVHDFWPVAGLVGADAVNVAWIAVLGYGLFRPVL
jgi:hypothetical protein